MIKQCITILLFMMIFACAAKQFPICYKDGKAYCTYDGRFRERWYQYYEIALSCIEGECYEQALKALEKAKETKSVDHRDHRMARTYGMHFINYFPHRETGIVYYYLGHYQKALAELEQSIAQQESDKAFFYYDKTMLACLEEKAQMQEKSQIYVNQALHENHYWTKNDPVTISGHASDFQYISCVYIDNHLIFMQRVKKTVHFTKQLSLDQGNHDLVISVKDLLGDVTRKLIHVHVDRFGPIISIRKKDDSRIEGEIYDDSGDISMTVNQNEVNLEKGKRVQFSIPVIPNESLIIIAQDKAGNTTLAKIGENIHKPLLADYWLFRSDITGLSGLKPDIHLFGWGNPTIVYSQRVDIEGNIVSQYPVQRLIIGDYVMPVNGFYVFFNQSVLLDWGDNQVNVDVWDKSGNQTTKTLSIVCHQPEIQKKYLRYTILKNAFEFSGYSENQHVLDQIFFDAVNHHQNRFVFLIQKQLESESKRIDAILPGFVYFSNKGVEITTRLVDIDTGRIMAIKDSYSESTDTKNLAFMAEEIVDKFIQFFPVVTSKIQRIDSKEIEIQSNEKISLGWPMIVYDECPKYNPVTDKFLGARTDIVGKARIINHLGKNKYACQIDSQQRAYTLTQKAITR